MGLQLMPLLNHETVARTGYDRQAHEYDARRYTSFSGQLNLALFRAELRRHLPPDGTGRTLDLATGTGIGAATYFGEVRPVFGADLSARMLRIARDRAVAAGARYPLTQANARSLPFTDGAFEGAFSLRFFHHVPHAHRRPIIEDLLRVLAAGGSAVLEFKNPFYGLLIHQVYDHVLRDRQGHYLYPWQVEALFEGFEIVATRGVYMPFAQVLARVGHRLGRLYTDLGRLWPLKFLCMHLFVTVRKPGAAVADAK